MTRFDRIYKIHDLLRNARHPVPMRVFMEELEASRNTITRDFEFLRDSLGAPLEYCRDHNGHRYAPDSPAFELPGFWMNPAELYALLACEQLLENVQPGMMTSRLAPLKEKIRRLLGESGHAAERVSERIQIQPIQARMAPHQIFDPVAEATLAGKQLTFTYSARSGTGRKPRRVHPQRLLHYRSNWYLLALCCDAQALRLFSLDRISQPQAEETPSQQIPIKELDGFAYASFGIFGGGPKGTAHLRFTHHAAEWVADETWHPDQMGEQKDDGYHLKVPYSDERELAMEVLRYGADVEVLGPPELREEVVLRIRKMAGVY
ncbi:MAG TPA: YafY family protein [Marinobacter sp.]|uniref:helix-turn-helix transcriptional regulator n=1 Tax=Marinobacter sp. TaxID=50741 RepID=UPI002D7E44E8|nr:YafY family protein [Marinobacter sp.]HET8802570.1 YafY family protein [Marinobacter sp.]